MRIGEIKFLSRGMPKIIDLGLLEIGDLIDVNGILDLSTKVMIVRRKITITNNKARLSSEDVEMMMVQDVEIYKAKDDEQREKVKSMITLVVDLNPLPVNSSFKKK
ncbi:heat shock cognate 70 kDa protein 2-like [Fagus crenata]